MNRTCLALTMGLLASLLGCGSQAPSVPANTLVIDYAHESGGVFHHGTFSLIDGTAEATWTIDQGGSTKSQEIPMSEEAFRGIWDGMKDIPDFQAGLVEDSSQQLDPKTHHVVGIIFSEGEQTGMRTHMIPAAGASAAFKEWLAKLGYTGQ